MFLLHSGKTCATALVVMFAGLFTVLARPAAGFAREAGPDASALADAAERRDRDAVKALLKPGVDVNAFGRDGTPALHWAVRADELEMAKALVAAGADVNLANRLGVLPLYLACDSGNVEMIRVLLDAGADPNAQYPAGEPLLWGAIHGGVFDAVKLMIDRGANFSFVDPQNQQTTLMYAVRENQPKVVKLLIDLGAPVNARTRTGATPGFVRPNSVAGFGHGVGIYRGGPPERGSRGLIPGGLTALFYAARDGRTEAAKILLDAGAELEATDPNGITPLLMAISNNHMETAKFLIDRGANLDATDWYGRTPIWSAVEVRNMDIDNSTFKNGVDREPVLEVIKILLEKGANPNPRSKEAMPIRRFMLPTTGTLEWVDFTGQTPFLYAARAGDVAAMRLLLEHGADPKIPTFGGTTALMAAAGINWTVLQTYDEGAASLLEAVKLCYELGMDVNAVNSMGLTALHGAANRGSDDIIKFLVEKGAKLDVKDNEGRTPLTWAEGVFLATHPSQPKPTSIALIKSLMGEK
ncbi:MAG TPA: ankyrin repeat domain-containing protein [Terriglobia bacterium]|nr:ankyrin repeat domain-containing protein [Terriglobia bacterium]